MKNGMKNGMNDTDRKIVSSLHVSNLIQETDAYDEKKRFSERETPPL